MAKNTLSDLNDHLFAQLERLGEEDLTAEEVKKEVDRAKAINGIAKNIVDNARVTLDGAKFCHDQLDKNKPVPNQFKLNE